MSVQGCSSRVVYGVVGVVCLGVLGCGRGTARDSRVDDAPNAVYDPNKPIYSYTVDSIDGWPVPLDRYAGNVLLVVNVASECRFTGQYANLQRLYMKYKDRGFVVLGFPANDFGRQEPGSNAEIKAYVSDRFGIRFPLFSKISVKGEDMHPVYRCLTEPESSGAFGGPITWNFNKFLIDRDGAVVARFDSGVDPLDPRVTAAIEAALR